MSKKLSAPIIWLVALSALLLLVFLLTPTFSPTIKSAGNHTTFLPINLQTVSLKGLTQVTEITLPYPLAAATGSWCTWGGCPADRWPYPHWLDR